MTFEGLMQKMVDLSYDERLAVARHNFFKLCSTLPCFFGDDQATASQAILVLVTASLGADGVLTEEECRFFNNLMGSNHSRETLLNTVTNFDYAESVEVVEELADTVDEDTRTSLLTLCLCFLAADRSITPGESDLIERLMRK